MCVCGAPSRSVGVLSCHGVAWIRAYAVGTVVWLKFPINHPCTFGPSQDVRKFSTTSLKPLSLEQDDTGSWFGWCRGCNGVDAYFFRFIQEISVCNNGSPNGVVGKLQKTREEINVFL